MASMTYVLHHFAVTQRILETLMKQHSLVKHLVRNRASFNPDSSLSTGVLILILQLKKLELKGSFYLRLVLREEVDQDRTWV